MLSMDIPIKITGTVLIPPCIVNDGEAIIVNFDNISVADVANERNRRKVVVPVKCSYTKGAPYLKVTGMQLGNNKNVLKTDIDNFDIALYQGDGTATKLLLGDGKHNGQESIGYLIEMGLSGKENGTFTFTAIPYIEGGGRAGCQSIYSLSEY